MFCFFRYSMKAMYVSNYAMWLATIRGQTIKLTNLWALFKHPSPRTFMGVHSKSVCVSLSSIKKIFFFCVWRCSSRLVLTLCLFSIPRWNNLFWGRDARNHEVVLTWEVGQRHEQISKIDYRLIIVCYSSDSGRLFAAWVVSWVILEVVFCAGL